MTDDATSISKMVSTNGRTNRITEGARLQEEKTLRYSIIAENVWILQKAKTQRMKYVKHCCHHTEETAMRSRTSSVFAQASWSKTNERTCKRAINDENIFKSIHTDNQRQNILIDFILFPSSSSFNMISICELTFFHQTKTKCWEAKLMRGPVPPSEAKGK